MIKRIITLLYIAVITLLLCNCTQTIGVHVYLIKDDAYFTYPIGSVKITKELYSSITEEDIINVYKEIVNTDDEGIIMTYYKIFSDDAMTNELSKNYLLKDNDKLYIQTDVTNKTLKLGPAYRATSRIVYYIDPNTVSGKFEYVPTNSLITGDMLYLPCENNTVAHEKLLELYTNYLRVINVGAPVDLSNKELVEFHIFDVEGISIEVISINESYELGDKNVIFVICYDGKEISQYIKINPFE